MSYNRVLIVRSLWPDQRSFKADVNFSNTHLDQLRSEGHNVDDGDVVHLSPARYAHINPYGKYRFNGEGEFNRKGLRPLRQPDSALA